MPEQSNPANAFTPPTWWRFAVCRKADLRTFFPRHYDGPTALAAKQICTGCPVRTACLEEALRVERDTKSRRHGVFGGMLPEERHQEWRRRTRDRRKRARAVRGTP
ncbi:WhiB family transcriptional regulator [Streptomyces sp. TRM43335]|uniref:WhiB family transcriptional regulator n=1 Tax=Streptomyces taklimakanensis TaxID=2569853 RepID=A0A6G2BDH5_9ACTN|nr:WhiB family transcriptional regulator [Streptomyces taklimakanensis]MTE20331.1 WhiB family transcriptional regulator [Streptomyces taklimakanensis]